MLIVRIVYQGAVAAVRALSPLLSVGTSKLARGIEGRRHAHQRLAAWGATLRDPGRPVVWFHAPSVGEGLQARAVKDALLSRCPDVQVVFTFFSPSAEKLADAFGADVAAYLPWDLRGPISRVLDNLDASAVVFTKTEIWPVLVAEARRRGVPTVIVGATVPEGAGRAGWAARALMRDSWAALSVGCAISDDDAARLIELGVPPERVTNTGDPGIDSAATRFDRAPREAPYLTPFRAHPRPTVVAGSTWSSDEAVLLPALDRIREEVQDVRVVIAPHEPTPDRVARLLKELAARGWRSATLADVEIGSAGGASASDPGDGSGVDAVVVDRVGVLAHLYGVGSVSFVGGGFHDEGLHSVLEPAAATTPVAFGPKHGNSRAAADLLGVGGAKVASNAVELSAILLQWLQDEASRKRAAGAAFEYIQRHRGASERTALRLEKIIRSSA